MPLPSRALGRGLSSLISSHDESVSTEKNKLAINQLVPRKNQPRKTFDSESLEELAKSIRSQGVIQPLLVRPLRDVPNSYEIIAGERRWRAAKKAGLTEVPVVITSCTDEEAMAAALVENLQREDLNPLEEAEALQALMDECKFTQEKLAEQVGKSRSAVANALRLLSLPDDVRVALADGSISAGHARCLLAVHDNGIQKKLFSAITEKGLSVRQTEAAVDTYKRTGILPPELDGDAKERQSQAKQPKKSASETLKELQSVFRKQTGIKATFTGDAEKGKLHIPYTSIDELKKLLLTLQNGYEKQVKG